MIRTLAELTSEYAAVTNEAEAVWQNEWKPQFDATMNDTDFTRVLHKLLAAAGATFTDELPGLLSVHVAFAKDGLRQRTKEAAP